MRRANEILKAASVFFAKELEQTDRSERFIDEHRGAFGVESICRTLGRVGVRLLPARERRAIARTVEDERLLTRIREVHEANFEAYGYRRTWKALLRAGETGAALSACSG